MLASFFFLARYIIITSLVLTYVEIGPGGDSIMAVVDAVKSEMLNVDWSHIFSIAKESLISLLDSISNYLADTNQ